MQTVVQQTVNTFLCQQNEYYVYIMFHSLLVAAALMLHVLLGTHCLLLLLLLSHTHTHPFNGHFSGTTRVSRHQKGKPIWILLKQETVSGSEIHWAICKSAPCSRQITTPAPHRSVFYRPDALPAAQPTASKHWRPLLLLSLLSLLLLLFMNKKYDLHIFCSVLCVFCTCFRLLKCWLSCRIGLWKVDTPIHSMFTAMIC